MLTPNQASDIAQLILDGFDSYRARFREITQGAAERFEQARWQEAQQASAERINLYEAKVDEVVKRFSARYGDQAMHSLDEWPMVKNAYIQLIEPRLDDELSETWFNSIFCSVFHHDHISDGCMFVHTTRPSMHSRNRLPQTWRYEVKGELEDVAARILHDYRFAVPYDDVARDAKLLLDHLQTALPDWVQKDPELIIEFLRPVFYRNKGAYLVGRIKSCDEQWPLVIPLVHREGKGIALDTVITDEAEVSIIFSFTRSYFLVEVPVPAEFVAFLKQILPGKQAAELYSSLGFYKHGKTEFYRAMLNHLANTDDKFIMAPGVRGMVMSVFTLPGFNTVFKIIKDKFAPPKEVNKQIVKEKYDLVKRHDRVGRMADTQQFSHVRVPKAKFEKECLDELLEVASEIIRLDGDHVVIEHMWVERRMIPLNMYLETASENQTLAAIDDYGMAIKQLAAANIFPGDMLLKNFGVTRHGRVVFYDYDEICYLTEVNFRKIPPPRYPEDEMASEPWYSVGPNDVFPEEFPVFLFADIKLRRLFSKMHADLFEASYWQGLQEQIRAGTVIDVFPYRRNHSNG